MKINKLGIFCAVALTGLFVAGPIASAQTSTNTPPAAGDSTPAVRPRNNNRAMMDQLNLTDDQKDKFKAAMKDQADKMKALREDTSVTGNDKRTKSKEIRDATEAKMKEILTPDQFTKWQEMTKHHGPRAAKPQN